MSKEQNQRLTSSKHQNYNTPGYFLDLVREVGPIGFDPFTSIHNNTGATIFCTKSKIISPTYTTKGSGLTIRGAHWHRLLHHAHVIEGSDDSLSFINPEYGKFLKLAALEISHYGLKRYRPDNYQQIVLVPARVETAWFKKLVASSEALVFWSSPTHGSRISFEHASLRKNAKNKKKGQRDTALFPCAVFYYGDRVERFREVFAPHGTFVLSKHLRLPLERSDIEKPVLKVA